MNGQLFLLKVGESKIVDNVWNSDTLQHIEAACYSKLRYLF